MAAQGDPLDQDWFAVEIERAGTLTVGVYDVRSPLFLSLDIVRRGRFGYSETIASTAAGRWHGNAGSASIDVEPGTYYLHVASLNGLDSYQPYYLCIDFAESRGLVGGFLPEPELHRATTAVKSEIAVYPNPATNFVTVSGLKEGFDYQVTTAAGQEVARGRSLDGRVDVRGLSGGTYLLTFPDGKGVPIIRRVVIARQ